MMTLGLGWEGGSSWAKQSGIERNLQRSWHWEQERWRCKLRGTVSVTRVTCLHLLTERELRLHKGHTAKAESCLSASFTLILLWSFRPPIGRRGPPLSNVVRGKGAQPTRSKVKKVEVTYEARPALPRPMRRNKSPRISFHLHPGLPKVINTDSAVGLPLFTALIMEFVVQG